MKPANWDQMTDPEKSDYAITFLGSLRGTYILSQALHYALETMKAVPPPHTEISNIADMEMLRETLFSFPIGLPDGRATCRTA